ncbi:MAG: serine hydrolase domain-containing protein [Anaerolineaceae bacterium]
MASQRAITPQGAIEQLDRHFNKVQSRNPSKPLEVKIVSQKLGLDYSFPVESDSLPWHTASIGKVFTAVLIYMLAEEGKLSIQDPITRFFSSSELERLFVIKGRDYAAEVTIEHLLGHTSGIADYFESKTIGKENFIRDILTRTGHHWIPSELIEFTREYQIAVAAPGRRFNYSDTGYILLGLLIEKVSGISFHQNLHERFFEPLEMRDSYLMFYSQPQNQPAKPIQPAWLNGVEVSGFESLSCDWSGGGIVSTTADLVKFNRALREDRLIQKSALAHMDICNNQFRPGIYYGLGMMEIHFKDFFFLLGGLPRVKGHIGILATHMFYDPINEAHIVLNFGNTARMSESFRSLIQIESILLKMIGDHG